MVGQNHVSRTRKFSIEPLTIILGRKEAVYVESWTFQYLGLYFVKVHLDLAGESFASQMFGLAFLVFYAKQLNF